MLRMASQYYLAMKKLAIRVVRLTTMRRRHRVRVEVEINSLNHHRQARVHCHRAQHRAVAVVKMIRHQFQVRNMIMSDRNSLDIEMQGQ